MDFGCTVDWRDRIGLVALITCDCLGYGESCQIEGRGALQPSSDIIR